jgi:lysozyme family protein
MPKRIDMAKFILDSEARRDKQGNLRVYNLPAADGGGTFEVAGINDRYHPEAANKLKKLIQDGKQWEAEEYVKNYLMDYTNVVANWTRNHAVEAFLRDTAFNRGPKGALRILQIALGVPDDGKFGPITETAMGKGTPVELLEKLRKARETYELRVAPPVGARKQFWAGLQNRWDNVLRFSKEFIV